MAAPAVVLEAHDEDGLPFAFTASAESLVTGGFDGSITRWSVDARDETATIDAHERSVDCGAVTTDGTLLTGSTDTTVRE